MWPHARAVCASLGLISPFLEQVFSVPPAAAESGGEEFATWSGFVQTDAVKKELGLHAVSAVWECFEPSVFPSRSKASLHRFLTRSPPQGVRACSRNQVGAAPVEHLTHWHWESDGPYDLVGTGDLKVGRKRPFLIFLKLPFFDDINTTAVPTKKY